MSPTCRPAASPSRSPANAREGEKAWNGESATSIDSATCSAAGSAMAASRRRSRGRVTPSLGSMAMTRSRTAARRTARTLLMRVRIVPGARPATHRLDPAPRGGLRRSRASGTSAKVTAPAATPHREVSRGLPHLPGGPFLEVGREADAAGVRVDVLARDQLR